MCNHDSLTCITFSENHISVTFFFSFFYFIPLFSHFKFSPCILISLMLTIFSHHFFSLKFTSSFSLSQFNFLIIVFLFLLSYTTFSLLFHTAFFIHFFLFTFSLHFLILVSRCTSSLIMRLKEKFFNSSIGIRSEDTTALRILKNYRNKKRIRIVEDINEEITSQINYQTNKILERITCILRNNNE